MKILAVEDNPLDAKLVRRALARLQPPVELEVIPNQRLAEARLLQEPAVDLVLSNLFLPDGTGLELIAFLREHSLTAPVVILTRGGEGPAGDQAAAASALKAGAADVLVKEGGYLDQLPGKIAVLLDRSHQELARRGHPIHVLYVENNANDLEVTRRFLARSAPHIQLDVVQTGAETLRRFRDPNQSAAYDVLLLDFRLPDMNALQLMKELRRLPGNEIPIVLVTSQPAEETGVQALRFGSVDYLVKNSSYLQQLPAVLENACNKAELIHEKQALKRSEERFRLLAENAQDVVYRYSFQPKPGFEYVSPSAARVTGYTPEDFYADPRLLYTIVHPDDSPTVDKTYEIGAPAHQKYIVRWVCKDRSVIWTEHRVTFIYDADNRLIASEAIVRDVTERRQHELELETMAAVSATLRSALTTAEMLPTFLERVLEITGSHGAMVTQVDAKNGDMLVLLGAGNFARITGSRMPVSQCLSGHVMTSGQIYQTATPRSDPYLYSAEILGEIDSLVGIPLTANDRSFGALLVGRSSHDSTGRTRPVGSYLVTGQLSLDRAHFTPDEIKLLHAVTDNLSNAIVRADLFDSLQKSNKQLFEAYNATIEGWSQALDLRDRETDQHAQRVTEMTLQLAQAAAIPEEDIHFLRWGALLHDIGKMGVPDSILRKPGPLDPQEWEIMRRHPEHAYHLLSPISYLRPAVVIPYCHHEKWDGTGYPRGLKGEQIPLWARLFAVIDVWEALTSDRPYRQAWSAETAAEYIRAQSGKHFDPALVELFFRAFGR